MKPLNMNVLRPLVLVVAADGELAVRTAESLEDPPGAMRRWLRVRARSCSHALAQKFVAAGLEGVAPVHVAVIVETGDPQASSAVLARELWRLDPTIQVVVLRGRSLRSEYVLEEIGDTDQLVVVPLDVDDDELAQLVLRGVEASLREIRAMLPVDEQDNWA